MDVEFNIQRRGEMKISWLNRPQVLVPVTTAIIGLLAYSGWNLRSENNVLRAVQAGVPSSLGEKPASRAAPPPPARDEAEASARLAELREQLALETAKRAAMEAKAGDLAAMLPTKEDELVVSFGRIEQMGQKSAKLIGLFVGESGKKMMTGKHLSPEEQQQMMDALQKHLVQIPELQRMEDDAREISRYHASALKEIYGLDAAASKQAAAFLEAEFARMKSEGITFSQRTEADKAAWETRRDAAMKDVALRMQPMLPANHPSLDLLPGVLNLGEGMRTTVKMNGDGHGSVNMALPLFPAIPSL